MLEVINQQVDKNQIPIYTGLIGGQPKTGKTTQAAKWSDKGKDGVLVIDMDMGADHVECNRIPVTSLNPPTEKIKTAEGTETKIIPPEERGFLFKAGPRKGEPMPVYSLRETLQFIMKKVKNDNFEYETVVLDTVDALNELVEESVMEEMGIDGMGQAGYGQDWNKSKEKNLQLLENFIRLTKKNAVNVLLVCHTKQRSIQEDGTVQESPALPRGLSDALQGKMTFICNVKRNQQGEPIADFKSFSEKQLGSRLEALDNVQIPFSYEAFKEQIQNYEEEDGE